MKKDIVNNLPEIEGDLIKAVRESKNISHDYLAQKFCVTVIHIEQLENGKRDKFYSLQHKNELAKKVGAELGISEFDLFKRKFSISFTMKKKKYSILVDKNNEHEKSEALINSILSKNLNVDLNISEHTVGEKVHTLDDYLKAKPEFNKSLFLVFFIFLSSICIYFSFLLFPIFSQKQDLPKDISINLSELARVEFMQVRDSLVESYPFISNEIPDFFIITINENNKLINLVNESPSKACVVYSDRSSNLIELNGNIFNIDAESSLQFVIPQTSHGLKISIDDRPIELPSNKSFYVKIHKSIQ